MLTLCILYYLLANLAIDFGLHRMLSHHAFALPKWLERSIITLSLPAGTPIQWCGNHRYHHAHVDTYSDPHSPITSGFWYAHVGWYIGTKNIFLCIAYALAGPIRTLFDGLWRPRTNQQYNYLARDIARDPYYHWVSQPLPYMLMMWLHVMVPFGIAFHLAGWTGLFAMWAIVVFVYNACDAADSIGHLYGEKILHARGNPRNNKILALITLGGTWHANHHALPKSARHGLFDGQFDLAWYIVKLLEKAGLANNIHLPSALQLKNVERGSL